MKRASSSTISIVCLSVSAASLVLALIGSAEAAESQPVRIGVVTFLSGLGAAPYGIPSRNGAEVVTEELNAGKAPAQFATKGFGGSPVELIYIDEAGGTAKQVTEYRNLVQRQNVDLVIGYVSSGDCLAIAPVAEELKKLTVIYDCSTPRIFEDASYKYVFRTSATGTMDNVAAARYVVQRKPKVKSVAGINQNYAFGHDSWNDFTASMKVLKPDIQIKTSQMVTLFSAQFNAQITALLSARADIVHSSFWGGDLDGLILQGAPRGLFRQSTIVLTTGDTALQKLGAQIPDGTVIGARGTFDVFAPDTALSKWFRKIYTDRYSIDPSYPAYKMVQAILGVKAAWEKAQAANGGKRPSQDQVIAAFEYLKWEGPGGPVAMAVGKGHQAVYGTAYGTLRNVKGKVTFADVIHYSADQVTPPDGVRSEDWIKAGFKPRAKF